jgi:hypothetical protein
LTIAFAVEKIFFVMKQVFSILKKIVAAAKKMFSGWAKLRAPSWLFLDLEARSHRLYSEQQFN